MRVLIAAVGRLRDGPEAKLSSDYLERAAAHGRAPGALYRATPNDARKILLDERGSEWASRQPPEKTARRRDAGVPACAFWIGGADGAAQTLKDQSDDKLALGRQTWPHKLVRVMLAEQIYRAITILANTPYHRD